MFNKIKTNILSWLIHHANREGKNLNLYAIKKRILAKRGKLICYDVQYIEGKRCLACGGSGIYDRDWDTNKPIDCRCCGGTGWFKRNTWNILEKIQFGKYTFHQPYQRSYTRISTTLPIINGYIEHKASKYGKFALFVLFLLYEKGYLKRWWQSSGNGWRLSWWLPKNWFNNLVHLIRKRSKAIPFQQMRQRRHIRKINRINQENLCLANRDNDELPF